jgi:hypothetical protein
MRQRGTLPFSPVDLKSQCPNFNVGAEIAHPRLLTMQDEQDRIPAVDEPPRELSPAAQRALAEAEERRKTAAQAQPAPEIGGRGGADPARFGDWEIKGRAIDF